MTDMYQIKGYEFRDLVKVSDFLARYQFLIPIVESARNQLAQYFPTSTFALEVALDPEECSDCLIISIVTDLAPNEALQRREEFNENWLYDQLHIIARKLIIILEYQ
jgi:hypothetical protein